MNVQLASVITELFPANSSASPFTPSSKSSSSARKKARPTILLQERIFQNEQHKRALGLGDKIERLIGFFFKSEKFMLSLVEFGEANAETFIDDEGDGYSHDTWTMYKKFIKRLENSIENFVREIRDDEDIAVIGKELRRASMVDPTSRLSILGAIMREAFAFTTFVHFMRAAQQQRLIKLANTTD